MQTEVGKLLARRQELSRLGLELPPDQLMLLKRLLYRLGWTRLQLQRAVKMAKRKPTPPENVIRFPRGLKTHARVEVERRASGVINWRVKFPTFRTAEDEAQKTPELLVHIQRNEDYNKVPSFRAAIGWDQGGKIIHRVDNHPTAQAALDALLEHEGARKTLFQATGGKVGQKPDDTLDWRPQESIPEDYYAMSRVGPHRLARLTLGPGQEFGQPFGGNEAMRSHDIHDEAGKNVGVAVVQRRNGGKHLYVHYVGDGQTDMGTNENQFGREGMRHVFTHLAHLYPDADTIGGNRMSGFRKGSSESDREVTFDLNRFRNRAKRPQGPQPDGADPNIERLSRKRVQVTRYARTISHTDPEFLNWWTQLTGRRNRSVFIPNPDSPNEPNHPFTRMDGVHLPTAAPFEDWLRENEDWRHWLLRGLAVHTTIDRSGPIYQRYTSELRRPDRGRGTEILLGHRQHRQSEHMPPVPPGEQQWPHMVLHHPPLTYREGGPMSYVYFNRDDKNAPVVSLYTIHPNKRKQNHHLESILTPSEYAAMRGEAATAGVTFPEAPESHRAEPERMSRYSFLSKKVVRYETFEKRNKTAKNKAENARRPHVKRGQHVCRSCWEHYHAIPRARKCPKCGGDVYTVTKSSRVGPKRYAEERLPVSRAGSVIHPENPDAIFQVIGVHPDLKNGPNAHYVGRYHVRNVGGKWVWHHDLGIGTAPTRQQALANANMEKYPFMHHHPVYPVMEFRQSPHGQELTPEQHLALGLPGTSHPPDELHESQEHPGQHGPSFPEDYYAMSRVKRYAMTNRSNFIDALRRIRSSNQKAVHQVAKLAARKLGLTDTKIVNALHDTPHGSVPGVAQAVYGDAPPEHLNALGAWLGLTSNLPGYAVFHARPTGPDALYRVRVHGSGMDMRARLDRAGITNRVIVPHRKGFDVIVPDQGNKMGPTVQAFADAHSSQVEMSSGHLSVVGSADQARAREMFRNRVVAQEQGA